MARARYSLFTIHRSTAQTKVTLTGLLLFLLLSIVLAACTSPFGTSAPVATPTPSQAALTKLHWCGKPLMLFRDEGAIPTTTGTPTTSTPTASPTVGTAGTPTTLTDWAQVQPLLGFDVYLPASLPPRTCLVSALGTVHDPIFGGSFTIGYLLPDRNSISISEAPLRSQKPDFQCTSTATTPVATPKSTPTPGPGTPVAPTPTPTPVPSQVCSGAKAQTNIVFSAPGDQNVLSKFFNNLQPGIKWVPAA